VYDLYFEKGSFFELDSVRLRKNIESLLIVENKVDNVSECSSKARYCSIFDATCA
jgi:hypothetical protein